MSVMTKLFTLGELAEKLAPTEGLAQMPLSDGSTSAAVSMPEGWNLGLKEADDETVTNANIALPSGEAFNLTKGAALELTSFLGITKDYVCRTPGPLIESNVNWWLANGEKEFKALVSTDSGNALAVTKNSITPFSNVQIVERVVSKLCGHTGVTEDDIRVDYKFTHNLRRTSIRLIAPAERTITSSRHSQSNPDTWSTGIHVRNSLVGEKPSVVSGYLFSWWCTNGAISTHATSGNYNRRQHGQGDEFYDWIGESADEILTNLGHELDSVQALTEVTLEDEVNQVLVDLFDQYKIPREARESIIAAMLESEDMTMYGVMQAVTQAANDGSLSDNIVTTLMEIGGDIPAATHGRCDHCHRLKVSV